MPSIKRDPVILMNEVHLVFWVQLESWHAFCPETGKTYRQAAKWAMLPSEERRELVRQRALRDLPKCSWATEITTIHLEKGTLQP